MTYIYLSYTKADRDSAFAMRDVLKKEGFRIWMDENKRDLSLVYWPQIQKNIRNAGLFVVLASDAAQKSAWLKRELDYAEKIKKPIRAFQIQGEGWERVNPYLTPLTLGLRLDVPQQAANEIKTVLYASKDNLIPQQIPSDAIGKFIPRLIIAVSIIVSALVLLPRFLSFLPAAQDFLQNSFVAPSPAPMTTRQVMEATSAASILTRAYETENAVEINRTARANAVEMAEAATADARARYQVNMNETAIARGGVLPCEAEPIENPNLYPTLAFYFNPHSAGSNRIVRIADIDYLVLTELVEVENTIWYRAESADGRVYGYIQAEWLVLDEDCPR